MIALSAVGRAGENQTSFTPTEAREAMERFAAECPYLDLSAVVFDRPDRFVTKARPADEAAFQRVLGEIGSPQFSKEALTRLLSHPVPKVRTLAIVALYQREDPQVLPSLVPLTGDDSPTFDTPGLVNESGRLGRPEAQTVGKIASRIVGFYLKWAGLGFYYRNKQTAEAEFGAYWKPRSQRSHCASWFAVQLARASQGTIPTLSNRVDHIRKVRERIDQLPGDERAYVLLSLRGEAGADALVSESELISLCKGVGPEKLIRILQRNHPSDDPDLQPGRRDIFHYKSLCVWILDHAAELLRPENIEDLKACERKELEYARNGSAEPILGNAWARAVAALEDPATRTKGLHEAYKRFEGEGNLWERARLSAALWKHGGDTETQFLTEWFYGEEPERGTSPHALANFVIEVSACELPSGRKLMAAIIRDPRFERLDFQTLEAILEAVNGWLPKPVVDPEEKRVLVNKFPMDENDFHWTKKEAEERYPEKTKQFMAMMQNWRDTLRGSIPDWVPK
jgi:hypothetical protein